MSQAFLGEIRLTGFAFAPKGWALCNGQLLPINQNQALFALLGTMYGGNGQTTFALPNLRGQVPVGVGGGFVQGQVGGEVNHTLSSAEMPGHQHNLSASGDAATTALPGGNVLAAPPSPLYAAASTPSALSAQALGSAGSSQPHNNMPPYTVLNFVIALQGSFPSRD